MIQDFAQSQMLDVVGCPWMWLDVLGYHHLQMMSQGHTVANAGEIHAVCGSNVPNACNTTAGGCADVQRGCQTLSACLLLDVVGCGGIGMIRHCHRH